MKTKLIPLIALIGLALLTAIPANAQIIDDFNDGNDDGWTRLSPLTDFGAPAVYSFPGGNSYQISSPVSPNPGLLGPARAGSLRLDASYAAYFQQSVDIVDWDNSQSNTAIGMLARISQPGLASTDGYSLTVNLNGVFEINRLTNEQAASLVATGSIGTLNPANDYRLVFTGDGSLLTGQIFNLANLSTPLATISGIDATYASGNSGLFVFTSSGTQTATATFDNYASATFGTPLAKANNSNNLNLGTSWLGGVAPTSADRAKWDSTVTGANTTSLGADLSFAGIVIANPTGPVTINPGNTLSLGAGVVDIDLSAATQDLTLNCALSMGAPNVWDVTSGRTLALGGVVSGSAGVTKQGVGTAILSSANTYTGGTAITAGTLKLSGTGTPGASGASVAVSSEALLDLNGTSQSIAFTAGTGVGTVANNAGSGTSTLTLSANPGANVVIQDFTTTSGGKVAVVVTVDSQGLSNSNTYSGGTTVNAGAFLYVNGASPLSAGTGTITLTANGGTQATSSGLVVDGATYANDITGAGYVHINGTGAAKFTGNLTTSGQWNFRSGTTGSYEFAGNGTTSVLSGVIGSTTNMVNGAVVTGRIIKSGSGTLTLSGANTFTGGVTINAGTLTLANAGALRSTAGSENAVAFGASSTGTLALGGNSVVIRSLNSNATPGTPVVENANAGNATLTVGNSLNLASTYAGTIQDGSGGGTLALTKAGTSTLTLADSNTFTGATTISAGSLLLGHVTALGGNNPGVNGTSAISMATGTTLRSTVSGVTISAPITTTGSVTIGAPDNNAGQVFSELILNGAIGGATTTNVDFRSFLDANTIQTVTLGAASTYAGNTTIGAASPGTASQVFVKLGIDNALPTTTILSIQGGAGIFSGRGIGLNLFGYNQTLAGLTNTAASLRVQQVVNSDVSAYATLTINGSTDTTYSGSLGNNSANFSLNPIAMPGSTNGNNFGLTKDGSGKFTISGANTYTGDTTVNAGVLAVTGSSIADTGKLVINGSGKVDLTNTETVATLFLGAVEQPAGNYSETSVPLGATITTASFTGAGTLMVGAAPTNTFANWISNPTFGLAPADQGFGADPDGDGIPNGVENFFGTNPGTFSQGLVAGTANPGAGIFTFTHPQNATPASDLTASYTWSKDLATFLASGATDGAGSTVSFTTQLDTPAPGITTVTATVTGTATSKLFVRVNVTQP